LILGLLSESRFLTHWSYVLAAQQNTGCKFIVRLSEEEREAEYADPYWQTQSASVAHGARLLKADGSTPRGLEDNQIAVALDTSIDTVSRTPAEDGLDAALIGSRKAIRRLISSSKWD
jgi:hypothetical protein